MRPTPSVAIQVAKRRVNMATGCWAKQSLSNQGLKSNLSGIVLSNTQEWQSLKKAYVIWENEIRRLRHGTGNTQGLLQVWFVSDERTKSPQLL